MERIACNILLYVKWIVSGNLLYDLELNWGSGGTELGGMAWSGEVGRKFKRRGLMYTHG